MGIIASQFYSFFGDISQLFRIGFRTAGGVPEYRQGSRRPGGADGLDGEFSDDPPPACHRHRGRHFARGRPRRRHWVTLGVNPL
jgi:hypothetical protein